MRIGVDHRFPVDHHANVTFPKDDVATLWITFKVEAKLVTLQITVRRTWDVAGQQACRDQARTIDSVCRVAAPKVRHPEMKLRDCCRVFERAIEGAQVGFGNIADVGFVELAALIDHRDARAEAKAHQVGSCDAVGWRALRAKAVSCDPADISVGGLDQRRLARVIGCDGSAQLKLAGSRALPCAQVM